MAKNVPNYKMIFLEILEKKYPEKKNACQSILKKKELSQFDVIKLNQEIFGNADQKTKRLNQKHKSYDKSSIFNILQYQKENDVSNNQLADHFKISRNTIAKWKKLFITK